MTIIAYIGLGSNLGRREEQIDTALAALGRGDGVRVRRRSALRETAPVGGPPQGPFLNGVAELEVAPGLGPADLLRRMLEVERRLGRVRDERWGPREIDLDLLLFGEETRNEPGLVLPHPRLRERRFVLGPLAEIDAGLALPPDGRTVMEVLGDLEREEDDAA